MIDIIVSNNPFLEYYKCIFPFKLQCEIKRKKEKKKKATTFPYTTMELAYGQWKGNITRKHGIAGRRGMLERFTDGLVHGQGRRAKKRKRRMIKFTSHLFCSFFFLSNRIIKVILQSAFRAATAP